MPRIMNQALYDAFYQAARSYFSQPAAALAPYTSTLPDGEPLYRYVSYRDFQAQDANAGRTVFPELVTDLSNRWSGFGGTKGGQQALYLTSARGGDGRDTRFWELEHYQDPAAAPEEKVAYFDYQPGVPPIWSATEAAQLRTMFLFSLDCHALPDGVMRGFNLCLRNAGQPSPIEEIYEIARGQHPDLVGGRTATELYTDVDDASFTRAVGNACLERFDFLQATSVRDPNPDPTQRSVSVVMKARRREPVATLKAQGRATFLRDPASGMETKGVVTIDDLQYNERFEAEPAAEQVLVDLRAAARACIDAIQWRELLLPLGRALDAEAVKAVKAGGFDLSHAAPESIVASVAQNEDFWEGFVRSITNAARATAVAVPQYQDYVRSTPSALRDAALASIIKNDVIQPRIDELTRVEDLSHQSYLTAAIKSAVLKLQAGHLEETGGTLQASITASTNLSARIRSEMDDTNQALADLKPKIDLEPANPRLLAERRRLETRIEDLVAEEQAREAEATRLQTDLRDTRRAHERSLADRASVDEVKRRLADGLFRGGV